MTTKQRLSLAASATVAALTLAAPALADVIGPPPSGPCDPLTNNFKNHGRYVSCVAHNEPHGSGEVISDAAQSDVGK